MYTISYSRSNDPAETVKAAIALKATGATVIVVGIGKIHLLFNINFDNP